MFVAFCFAIKYKAKLSSFSNNHLGSLNIGFTGQLFANAFTVHMKYANYFVCLSAPFHP